MSRSNKDAVFLEVAKTIGQLGTCDRAYVGAVLTHNGRAISWGFNGAPPGAPHCEDNAHGWADVDCGGFSVEESLTMNGCRNSVHAEANAIAFAARQGISTEHAILYVERTPCLSCAHLCIAAGIEAVVCATRYRDLVGEKALRLSAIPIYYITDEEEIDG